MPQSELGEMLVSMPHQASYFTSFINSGTVIPNAAERALMVRRQISLRPSSRSET